MLALLISLFAAASSMADSCTGKPAPLPGVLKGTCSVTIAKTETFNFSLASLKEDGTSDDGYNGLAVFMIEVPVPGSTSGEIYGYTIQMINTSGVCTYNPARRLGMMLVYNPPFCEPPTLDGKPQQCDGPEDPDPASAGVKATPAQGAVLHLAGGNSQLTVTCDAKFIAN